MTWANFRVRSLSTSTSIRPCEGSPKRTPTFSSPSKRASISDLPPCSRYLTVVHAGRVGAFFPLGIGIGVIPRARASFANSITPINFISLSVCLVCAVGYLRLVSCASTDWIGKSIAPALTRVRNQRASVPGFISGTPLSSAIFLRFFTSSSAIRNVTATVGVFLGRATLGPFCWFLTIL